MNRSSTIILFILATTNLITFVNAAVYLKPKKKSPSSTSSSLDIQQQVVQNHEYEKKREHDFLTRSVLKEFYESTGGSSHWKHNTNWPNYNNTATATATANFTEGGEDFCSWYGIQCSPIYFTKNNENSWVLMEDHKEESLTSSSPLQTLRGNVSSYTSTLYSESQTHSNLSTTSTLPPSSSSSPSSSSFILSVTAIRLPKNGLRGNLPFSIFQLPYLEVIDLGGNRHLRVIHSSSSNEEEEKTNTKTSFTSIRSSLKTLMLNETDQHHKRETDKDFYSSTTLSSSSSSSNALLNYISSSSSQLETLVLANSNLRGPFPQEILSLSSLKYLDLSDNWITGTIPSTFGYNMTSLRLFTASDNLLTGQIPSSLGGSDLKNLDTLDLSYNFLEGTLPQSMNSLSLETLFLNDQRRTTYSVLNNTNKRGNHNRRRRRQLMKQQQETNILSMNENNLSNKKTGITGPLLDFASMTKLSTLNLARNNLTGTIPSTLLASVNPDSFYTMIDLSSNSIQGGMPADLKRFSVLRIYAMDNQIEQIDETLCGQSNWFFDEVDFFGCDAILCPPSTASLYGRQISIGFPCEQCPNGIQDAPFFGSLSCRTTIKELEIDHQEVDDSQQEEHQQSETTLFLSSIELDPSISSSSPTSAPLLPTATHVERSNDLTVDHTNTIITHTKPENTTITPATIELNTHNYKTHENVKINQEQEFIASSASGSSMQILSSFKSFSTAAFVISVNTCIILLL